MPQIGFACCDGTQRSFAECLAHSLDCACPWSAPILEAISLNQRQEQPHLTVTELLGCPRATVLKKLRPYFESPETGWYKLRGTLMHYALVGLGGEAIIETRFARQLPNQIVISGQPDVIYPQRSLMFDLKTAKYIPRTPHTNHVWQLNSYRWLVGEHHKIYNLEVLYCTNEAVRLLQVEIMEEMAIVDFLMLQAATVTAGLAGDLPERTGEDGLWQCGYCPFTGECWPQGTPKKVRSGAKA